MKDYAKRSPRPQIPSPNKDVGILLTFIISALVFIGYIAHHFMHQKLLAEKAKQEKTALVIATPNTINAAKTSKKTAQHKKTDVNATTPTNEPKYDFYTLLPAMTVTIPDDETTDILAPKATPAKNKAEPLPPSGNVFYVLQVASLQSETDATQVQNSLKNVGYHTFVQHFQAPDRTTWYRVMVGPFNNIKEAETQQRKLYAHQMEALLLKAQR